MIFYFSGTGNSRWVAEEIAAGIGDRAVDLAVAGNGCFSFGPEDTVGIVYPVYAWAPPPVVTDFAQKLEPRGAFVFSLCTYGDEAGNAMDVLGKAVPLDAAYGLAMPNNYLILFDVDSPEEAEGKLEAARLRLPQICEDIKNRRRVFDVHKGFGRFFGKSSGKIFQRFACSAKPFSVNEACNGCGMCEKICPAKAICMTEGRPKWAARCYQCMACINRCPKVAINYGKHTQKKGRYYFKEVFQND